MLAYRHQRYSLSSKLLKSNVRSAAVVEHNSIHPVCTRHYADVLCSFSGIEETDDMFVGCLHGE